MINYSNAAKLWIILRQPNACLCHIRKMKIEWDVDMKRLNKFAAIKREVNFLDDFASALYASSSCTI